MLRSIGKQSRESVESVRKKKRYTTVGKICRKGRFFSLEWKSEGVMDDESGELMELMLCYVFRLSVRPSVRSWMHVCLAAAINNQLAVDF